jgi:hypothetical protein
VVTNQTNYQIDQFYLNCIISFITLQNKLTAIDLNLKNGGHVMKYSRITKVGIFLLCFTLVINNSMFCQKDKTVQEGTISTNNPMGKTWVVFIENSNYETFPSLAGPVNDFSSIKMALANYQISNIIHKKDMTKSSMEKFFNIELRDLVKQNQVKSLLVWYAGHGKLINDIGYWIPVDAKRDDEFTYFNISSMKAGLQGYDKSVVHTLIVADASESGPGFYTAMRSSIEAPSCDNKAVAGAKSAQVFTSAGFEKTLDNSKFATTFANTLLNNRNTCIPIETIVKSVTAAVASESGQKPKFGKVQGLEDENGTFFFIAK